MNWKIFITAFATLSIICLPKNIFSCGGSIDPYDYYISFFSEYNAAEPVFKPFYYTYGSFLYDDTEPRSTEDSIISEWVAFTNGTVSKKDVTSFIMKYDRASILNLYNHLEKNISLPDSIKENGMTNYFLKNKNLEALGYIIYAKQVEPYVTASYDDWDTQKRDSLKMNAYLKNGLQLYKAATADAFKLKYAYQVLRLAHYNHRYKEAITYYDDMVAPNPAKSILHQLSDALKAGALYRLGDEKQAAYIFSKSFFASDIKKLSNYISFDWATGEENAKREDFLNLCKNNEEKANMLSMFLMGNPETDLATLKEIYTLHPEGKAFSTLLVREINKYEDSFLSPLLGSQNGQDQLYYTYREGKPDSVMASKKTELAKFLLFLDKIGSDQNGQQANLAKIGAAYIAYMMQNYPQANKYLGAVKKENLSQRLQDQWMITNLLVTISESQNVDPSLEQKILPSLQWLFKKINFAKERWDMSKENNQWARFFRNVMINVLAPRYVKQGNLINQLLVTGAADSANYSYPTGIEILRTKFNGLQAENLYNFLQAKKFTPYESFLVGINVVTKKEVADYIGTAYLRDHKFEDAITWLDKEKLKTIEKNPFIELMYDQENRLPGDNVTTSKLQYAKEMKRLVESVASDKKPIGAVLPSENAAKNLYKLALGYYNTTYYGYAWELVNYYRSGADGYYIPKDATEFEKDYYGCYTAAAYFKKAMDATTDKEFKAKCLFMIAKCNQKQLRKPQYNDYPNDYDLLEKKEKEYYVNFANNKYFPQFQSEYKGTNFYKESLTRCSYLKDFVKGK